MFSGPKRKYVFDSDELALYNIPHPEDLSATTCEYYNSDKITQNYATKNIKPSIDSIRGIKSWYESYRRYFFESDYKQNLIKVAEKLQSNQTLTPQEEIVKNNFGSLLSFYLKVICLQTGRLLPDFYLQSYAKLEKLNKKNIKRLFHYLGTFIDVQIDHLKKTYQSASLNGMRWENYIENYCKIDVENLIDKNPGLMQEVYRKVTLFELAKRAHEDAKVACITEKYRGLGGKQICKQLAAFKKQIQEMESHFENDERVVKFKELYFKTEQELIEGEVCNLKYTPFPTVLSAFTKLAKEVNNRREFSENDLTKFAIKLDNDIKHLKPMSPRMKAIICGVIGAVVGAALGFVVGAAVSFWGGGFGGLPAAIAGGVVGMTLGQALVIGGVGAAAGVLTGSLSAGAGFFSGKKKNSAYGTAQAIEAKILSVETTAVVNSLKVK